MRAIAPLSLPRLSVVVDITRTGQPETGPLPVRARCQTHLCLAFACGVAGDSLPLDRVGWDERPPAWERFVHDKSCAADFQVRGLPCGRTGAGHRASPRPLV